MEFSSMETERLRLIEINQEHKQKIFEIFFLRKKLPAIME